jgi:hypothetical protein
MNINNNSLNEFKELLKNDRDINKKIIEKLIRYEENFNRFIKINNILILMFLILIILISTNIIKF